MAGRLAIIETAGERVYRRLRADIISGRLAPSQRLKLEVIKEAYGVSISTLRELLNRLTSEGLIVAESARGFEVAPVSAEHFRETASLRLLLESHALERSFAAGDMEWEGRVVAAHHKLASVENRIANGGLRDDELLKRYDSEFHQALLSACGSKVLLDAHAAIFDKYIRYLMIAVIFRGEAASREHRQLLDCALKRDAVSARKVLTSHIQDCVAYTLSKAPPELLGGEPLRRRTQESASVPRVLGSRKEEREAIR
ncbi:MAG TPA: GntR family transcriptional regulator [Pseudolabrys sp.]|jgi:DNA-binding GntR family transcriptional regulator|nr:GntR family transcriptional regulator [Pseudolabrys sp.]